MGQQHDRLGEMTDLTLGQARLVVVYQGDDISAGHVAIVDDRESGGVAVVLNVDDVARWNGRSNRACVEKIGK